MSGLCTGAGFNDNTVSLSVLTKIEMPFFYSNKMHPCSHQRLGEGRQESWISGLINLFGWFRWQLFLCESHLIITSASSPVSSASLKSVFYPGIKQEIRSILSKNLLAATATQNTTEEHFQNLSFSLSLKLKPQADVCSSLCVENTTETIYRLEPCFICYSSVLAWRRRKRRRRRRVYLYWGRWFLGRTGHHL